MAGSADAKAFAREQGVALVARATPGWSCEANVPLPPAEACMMRVPCRGRVRLAPREAVRTLRTGQELTKEQLAEHAGLHWTLNSGIEPCAASDLPPTADTEAVTARGLRALPCLIRDQRHAALKVRQATAQLSITAARLGNPMSW